ncbi:hypothetical protein [Aquimarina aggregata]|uniref:hypothetical protein n=1 Tax=Aquimarina aggregata TaxID=1642818 RepID=UPI0024910B6D|nr:hypothetical protein [Aquimarina aggregata]
MKYIIIVIIVSLVSCNPTKNESLFQLDEIVSKVINKNDQCNSLLSEHYGVNPDDIRSYNFIDGISSRISRQLQLQLQDGYTKALLIRTFDSGEIVQMHSFSVLMFPNNKALISEHIKDRPLKETSKEIENFSVNELYAYIGQKGRLDVKGRKNILVIEFEKKDSCNCRIYSDFSYEDLKEFQGFD